MQWTSHWSKLFARRNFIHQPTQPVTSGFVSALVVSHDSPASRHQRRVIRNLSQAATDSRIYWCPALFYSIWQNVIYLFIVFYWHCCHKVKKKKHNINRWFYFLQPSHTGVGAATSPLASSFLDKSTQLSPKERLHSSISVCLVHSFNSVVSQPSCSLASRVTTEASASYCPHNSKPSDCHNVMSFIGFSLRVSVVPPVGLLTKEPG